VIGEKTRDQARDGHRPFRPSQAHADALVQACGEGQVAIGTASYIEAARVLKPGRVAVRRAGAQGKLGADRQFDAMQRHGYRDRADAELVQLFQEENLLHAGPQQFGAGQQPPR